jgi:hypothetical protein
LMNKFFKTKRIKQTRITQNILTQLIGHLMKRLAALSLARGSNR